MTRPGLAALLAIFSSGCGLFPEEPEPLCSPRKAWQSPDDPSLIYIGCGTPEGWTPYIPPSERPPADTGDTSDTFSDAHSGLTDEPTGMTPEDTGD